MTMQDEDQKIFLYNRKLFTDSSIIPKEVKLKPYEMLEPPLLTGISHSNNIIHYVLIQISQTRFHWKTINRQYFVRFLVMKGNTFTTSAGDMNV